jgi:hypothetical protein
VGAKSPISGSVNKLNPSEYCNRQIIASASQGVVASAAKGKLADHDVAHIGSKKAASSNTTHRSMQND